MRWRYDVGRLMSTLEELLGTTSLPLPAVAEPSEERPHARAHVEPAATAVSTRAPARATEPLERRAPPTPPTPPPERRWPPRRPWLLAAAGVPAILVLAGLAIAGVFGGGDEGGAGESGGRPPRVSATIAVGRGPDGLTVDGGLLWVADQVDNVVRRVDVETNKPIGAPIPVGQNPDAVATFPQLGKQLVWVTTGPSGTVRRIDRASATTVGGPVGIGTNTIDAFVGKNGVYVSDKGADMVTRVDSATAKRTGGPVQVGEKPRGLVEAEGSV
jgi:hypothetical protein